MKERRITQDQMIERLRWRIKEAGSQTAFGYLYGFNCRHISKIVRGAQLPPDRLLRILGLKKEITYIETGDSQ